MKQKWIIAAALALSFTLAACGQRSPSIEEVEAAIEDGSVTVQDALDKGWVTQEWADNYQEEHTLPAADKIAINQVGTFETETSSGEVFTNSDLPNVAYLAFLDVDDAGAADFYDGLVRAAEGVRDAGAEIIVCSKDDVTAELFTDAPFPVVAYNDAMQEALAQNDEMASCIPCTGVWYVNGSLVSAWNSSVDADDLADTAVSFVSMGQETDDGTTDGTAAIAMG